MLSRNFMVSMIALGLGLNTAFGAASLRTGDIKSRTGTLRIQPVAAKATTTDGGSSNAGAATRSGSSSRLSFGLPGVSGSISTKSKLPASASAATVADLKEKLAQLEDDIATLKSAGIDEGAVRDIVSGELADYATVSSVDAVDSAKLDKNDFVGYFESAAADKKLVDKTELGGYAKKSDLDNYAKNSDLSDTVKSSDLSDYAKKETLEDYLKETQYNTDKIEIERLITEAKNAADSAKDTADSAKTAADSKLTKEQTDELYAPKGGYDSDISDIRTSIYRVTETANTALEKANAGSGGTTIEIEDDKLCYQDGENEKKCVALPTSQQSGGCVQTVTQVRNSTDTGTILKFTGCDSDDQEVEIPDGSIDEDQLNSAIQKTALTKNTEFITAADGQVTLKDGNTEINVVNLGTYAKTSDLNGYVTTEKHTQDIGALGEQISTATNTANDAKTIANQALTTANTGLTQTAANELYAAKANTYTKSEVNTLVEPNIGYDSARQQIWYKSSNGEKNYVSMSTGGGQSGSGVDGHDGCTPTVEASEPNASTGCVTLTITPYKLSGGTCTAQTSIERIVGCKGEQGNDGLDGCSPEVTATQPDPDTGCFTLTITPKSLVGGTCVDGTRVTREVCNGAPGSSPCPNGVILQQNTGYSGPGTKYDLVCEE